jgi:hypothetical protein
MLCQRYFFSISGAVASTQGIAAGFVASTSIAVVLMNFPCEMRVKPTVATTGIGNFWNYSNAGTLTLTALTMGVNDTGRLSARIAITSAGLTPGEACLLLTQNASAFLYFDSEI